MNEGLSGARWRIWLPMAAVLAAATMVTLAWFSARTEVARHDLALEGRILGIAHTAERELRDVGVDGAGGVLAPLLEANTSEILGLRLLDSDGIEEIGVGECGADNPKHEVDLFLGRFAAGGSGRRGGPGSHGRGRVTLEVFLAPNAGAPPLASRLVLPATVVVGLIVVALAVLAARLVERQRLMEVAAADRRRLEGLARAGAGLAHQLRTPLATIKGSCQLVLEATDEGDGARRLEAAVREAERMERTLQQLLDYARPPRPEPASVALAEVVAGLADRYPRLSSRIDAELRVQADPTHLEQLLGNLVGNAVEWSPEDEAVTISARRAAAWVVVEISDRGPGPGDDPEQLFEPYVTGRADGTGLGLAMARTLVEVNGGRLALRQAPGGGCIARVELPAAGGSR